MYPDFYHLLRDLFGIEIPVLSLFKTFGFLVAIAFFAAGIVLYKELKRKEAGGLIGYTVEDITTGKPAGMFEYLMSAIIGFLLGYKFIGMLLDWQQAAPDPLNYISSSKGNLLAGIVLAVLLLVYKFYSSGKEAAQGIQVKKVMTWPHSRVGDMAVIAAIGGFAGAKIFNALETWDEFIQDPLGSLLSSSGLTFYGGLIVATIALWIYTRKLKIDFRHVCDAAAPALILAYGIGRLGCQISGDGDWGIYNSAYITSTQYKVVPATEPFETSVARYADHVYRHFEKDEAIPHKSFKGPEFLPGWMFAYNYPKNVNNVGIPMNNCTGSYCSVLPIPVFPTPVYEFLMGLLIFSLLWWMRRKFTLPLSIFSIYLIFNGVERFLIEQIRVNSVYDWGWLKATQAEIIAVCMVACGILLFALRKKIDVMIVPVQAPPQEKL